MTVHIPLSLDVSYPSASDLARDLVEHATRGALLLPLGDPPPGIQQFQQVSLRVSVPGDESELPAEVLQVIPRVGLVVRLSQPELAASLAGEAIPAGPEGRPKVQVALPQPDEVESAAAAAAVEQELLSEERAAEGAASGRRGMGPVSWPVEKLQADWHTLTPADKARVAKYGKRPARGLILRTVDSTLHQVLLSNPQITPEEVAVLAGTPALDSAVLKRLVGNQDWLRHAAVARNLVCHPKVTLPQITRILDHLTDNDLRQLTRSGRVRASVKRLIMKKLEQRAGRR